MNHDVNSVGVTRHFNIRVKSIEKNIEKRLTLTQSIEKSFFHQAKSIAKNSEKR